MRVFKAIGLALTFFSVTATAKPQNITELETALLPRYCIDTEYFEGGPKHSNRMSPRAPYWVSVMGEGFWWMHHYCSGLIFLNRAQSYKLKGDQKHYAFLEARMEFVYTIKQLPKDFILLPEIYTKLGEAEIWLSNYTAASSAFLSARTLKPDYWPAYTKWADILIRQNKKDDAKNLLIEGLRHSPDSKLLIEQYKKLGGNPSEIQTHPTPITTPESSPTEPTASSDNKD